MPLYRATVKLNRTSGVSADASINVIHLSTPAANVAPNFTAWGVAIGTFYDSISSNLSPAVSRVANAQTVSFSIVTRLTAGAANDVISPLIWMHPFTTLTAAAGVLPLPSEVAMCLSYRTVSAMNFPVETPLAPPSLSSIRPRSRRMGRMFLGPFNDIVIQATAAGTAEFKSTTRTNILNSFDTMINGLRQTATPANRAAFVVYSPSDNTYRAIDHAWIDNAPDSIRGRGEKSASRVTKTIVPQDFTELE